MPQQPYSDAIIANRVSGPAIALIVFAALNIALHMLGLLGNLFQFGGGMGHFGPQGMPMQVSPAVNIAGNILNFALSGLVIFGAIKMKNLENYGLAMAASIVALLPCTCCCLLGLPFGIWSLVVLSDAQVKAAFRG